MISGATEAAFKFLFEHLTLPQNVAIEFNPHILLQSNKEIKILWAHYNCDQQIYLNVDWEKITHVVCVSNWEKEQFIKFLKIPENKISVIRNGGADYFKPLEKKSKTLIYTSTPFRGLKYLPYIFKRVLKEHPDAKLKIFSGMNLYGLDDEPYETLYQELSEIENVEISKAIPHQELVEHYQESMIFCYPNIWEETSCVSLIEAMRCGCYPIISDIGALPETSNGFGSIIKMSGKNTSSGWEPDELFLNNFSKEVCRILTIYSYDQKISDFSCEYFDWKKITKEWENLICTLQKGKKEMNNELSKIVEKSTFDIAEDSKILQMAYDEVFKWEKEDKEHAQGRSNFQIEKFILLDNYTIPSAFNAMLKNRRVLAEGLLTKIIEITRRKRDFDKIWKEYLSSPDRNDYESNYDLELLTYETYMKSTEIEIRDRVQQMEFFDKILNKLVEMNGGPITREQFEQEDYIYWERRFANQAFDDLASRITGINQGNIHSMRRATAPTLLDDDKNRVKNGYPPLADVLTNENVENFLENLQTKILEGIGDVTGKKIPKIEKQETQKVEQVENKQETISPKSLFNSEIYNKV